MPRRYIVAIVGLAASVIVVGIAVASINADIRSPAVPWFLLAGGLGVIVAGGALLVMPLSDLNRSIWPTEVKDVDDRGRMVVLRPVEELPCEWRPSREERKYLSRWRGRKPPKSLGWILFGTIFGTMGAAAIAAMTLAHFDVAGVWLILLFPLAGMPAMIGHRIFMRWHCRAILDLGRCASCGYDLTGLPIADDNCRVCPECGAAWKLTADRPTLSPHGEDAGEGRGGS